jgi:hypothetical protein
MPMMLAEEIIQSFWDLSGEISLVTLLANIGWYILNDEHLLTMPDFQRGLSGSQLASTQIAPVDCPTHLFAFRVL